MAERSFYRIPRAALTDDAGDPVAAPGLELATTDTYLYAFCPTDPHQKAEALGGERLAGSWPEAWSVLPWQIRDRVFLAEVERELEDPDAGLVTVRLRVPRAELQEGEVPLADRLPPVIYAGDPEPGPVPE